MRPPQWLELPRPLRKHPSGRGVALGELCRSAFGDHLPAVVSGAGTHLDDAVRLRDY